MAAASRHALMFPRLNLEKPGPNLPTDRRDLNLEGSHVLSQHVGLSCPSIFEPRQSGGRVAVRRLRAALRVRPWFGPGPTTLPLFIVGQDL